MTSKGKFVTYSIVEDGIAVVKIDNPPVNSLTDPTTEGLVHAFTELREYAESWKKGLVVILTGAGEKIFVAGADINKFLKLKTRKDGEDLAGYYHKAFDMVCNFEWPVICAINGAAIGGGMELALACDIRIAAENARLSLTEVKLGIIPGGGGTQRLARLIGPGKAKEIIFTGNTLDANTALDLGVVEHVVSKEKLLDEALGLARQIIVNAPVAIKMAKIAIDKGLNSTLQGGLSIEKECVGVLAATEDVKEGARAFLEKRKSSFQGV